MPNVGEDLPLLVGRLETLLIIIGEEARKLLVLLGDAEIPRGMTASDLLERLRPYKGTLPSQNSPSLLERAPANPALCVSAARIARSCRRDDERCASCHRRP
jgi:hypothetical protein